MVIKLKPFILFLISITLSLLGIGNVFSQQKNVKKKLANKKPAVQTQPVIEAKSITNFLAESFQIQLDKLPKNFQGVDMWKLIVNLDKSILMLPKGEFETTSQYEQRIENEKKRPLIGSITTNSTFAFVAEVNKSPTLLSSSNISNEYDADNQIMSYRFEDSSSCFSLASLRKSIEKTRPDVLVYWTNQPCLLINNWEKFSPQRINLEVSVERAVSAKYSSQVLFIGKLLNPFLSKSQNINNNPIRSNKTFIFVGIKKYSINFSLEEIWIFNKQTGEIYLKKVFESKKQENQEFPIENVNNSELRNSDDSTNKINESLKPLIGDARFSPNPKENGPNEVVLDKPIRRTSQFYFIGGEVVSGGRKDYIKGLTLTQTILESGGLKKSNIRKVIIRRKNADGLLVSTEFDLKAIINSKVSDPLIEAGDMIEIGNY